MPRLLVLLSAVCFGTTGTAQALGAAGASPVTVGEARIVVGALLLQGAARWATHPAGRPTTRPLPVWPRTRAAWFAAVGVAAYQVTFFAAVRTTGVAVGTVVALGSAPVLTGVLGTLTGEGRPDRRWLAATGLAGVGLAVLTLAGTSGAAGVQPLGVLLATGAAASYATYTLAVKRTLTGGGLPEPTMAAAFTGGAVLLLPVLALAPLGWLATPRGLLAALWLGAVPTALAYLLFARGLRRISAAETSTLTLAEPLTAAALGVVLLGERPSAASAVGAALLLAGLLVLGVPRSAPAAGTAAAAVAATTSGGAR